MQTRANNIFLLGLKRYDLQTLKSSSGKKPFLQCVCYWYRLFRRLFLSHVITVRHFFKQVYCYSAAFFNRHVVTMFLKSVQKEFYILSPSSPENHIGPTNFIFDNVFQSLSFPEWSTFFFMNGNFKTRNLTQRHIFCYELKSNFYNMVFVFINSFYKAKTKPQSTRNLRANNN